MTDWHKNEDIYIKKAQGENLIGFQKVWTPQSGGQVVSKDDLLSHADFGKVMYKWHSKTNAVSERLYSVLGLDRVIEFNFCMNRPYNKAWHQAKHSK